GGWGDRGAGRTASTQGWGGALGVTTRAPPPTCTVATRYQGPGLTLNHLDVYRLDHIDEVRDLGLHELLDSRSVTLVEWGDAIAGALPGGYLEVRIRLGDGPDDRLLDFRIVGSEWSDRDAGLRALTAGGDRC
ncbi:MAG: tRNA (adenosine(37)-N6)-threonylcarbamoyltransferase complex ATPase subunit type 1 TsaE, partial [Actinobacteria bacterium]|nr:tRNA (adenosine(37)-N6)-threonylcarbamoyltransferase complex ATPase subunit type 1 TsaE [Actinomycetota bacterium]